MGKNYPPGFHLCQVSVVFGLHQRPHRSDPGFNKEHRSHTSSISGDHKPVLPEAGGPCRWFGGWTEAGGGEAWQQLLCAAQGGGGPSLMPVNHRPSNSRKTSSDRFMRPPPFIRLHSSRPPLPLCALWQLEVGQQQRNAQNTQDRTQRKKWVGIIFFFFSPCVPKTLGIFFP